MVWKYKALDILNSLDSISRRSLSCFKVLETQKQLSMTKFKSLTSLFIIIYVYIVYIYYFA